MMATLKFLLAALLIASPVHAEDIAVIVNAVRGGEFDREQIAQIFLKKRLFWSDGSPILAINHSADRETRARFDEAIFGDMARALPRYWNNAYFRGVLPPPTLASDEAVRRFVIDEPRAIGYVRASVVDDLVRVVFILHSGSAD